jgi:hypothetical protein
MRIGNLKHLPEAAATCLEPTRMPKSRVSFELELDQYGIPHQFCRLALYWRTVKDLKKVDKELGDSVKSRSLNIEVCRRLHNLILAAFESA